MMLTWLLRWEEQKVSICLQRLVRMLRLVVFVVVCVAASAASLQAQSLMLNDLVVDNTNGTMTLHYGLVVEDLPAIKEALKDGLHLQFVGHVALYRQRSFWWDAFLVEKDFVCDLWEDILKQEVIMTIAGQEIRFPTKDFASVFQKRLDHLVVPLGPWSMVERGTHYIITLSLTINRVDVPAWIRLPLFFWSWDVVPETSFEMEFAY
ncbi:MAG: hypothetical protein CSA21_05880 [Deltaproteobacteria bacterium]|nr:MAG: hypothetical protein CSA21_05880 [Deltaproteobacteria bacterium]